MLKTLLISLVTLGSLINFANAGIIVSNTIPASLEANSAGTESNTDIFLFTERQNLTLGSDLNVDYLSGSNGSSGSIAAGTMVNSFIFHFDGIGSLTDGMSLHSVGTHVFDFEILAVIWTSARPSAQPQTDNNLDASDSILGISGLAYATGTLGRGLEVESFYNANQTADTFIVTGNQIELSVFSKAAYIEQIRVITRTVDVPEPTTLLLFGSALALFGFRRLS